LEIATQKNTYGGGEREIFDPKKRGQSKRLGGG